MVDLTLLQTFIKIYKASNDAYDINVTTKISGIARGLIVPENLEKTTKNLEEVMEMTSELIFSMIGISMWQESKREKAFEIILSSNNIENISEKLIKISEENDKSELFE